MTIAVDDRVGPPVFERSAGRSVPRGSGVARWRFASRLARREVRRRPGRTILVMLLVAIPVFGMTALTVLVRTNQNDAAAWRREFGRADLMVPAAKLPNSPALPAGSSSVTGRFASSIGLALSDGTARLADVTDVPLDNSIVHGVVLVRSGRVPTQPGEALISPSLARAFHVGVGDTLRISSPGWTERVVGIGVRATNWNEGFVAVRGTELARASAPVAANTTAVTLVKLPGHPSKTTLDSYSPTYQSVVSIEANEANRNVDWVLVGGLVALAIVGIVISGAFAVGARRQLVTLGQLSANGADEGLLRRTLSLQGLWCGALGSVLGIAAGLVTLFLMRSNFESWLHHDPGAYIWPGVDLAAIVVTGVVAATVAAFIPARSAARVPVLSALAGRRPLGSLPRRIVPIGAALFGSGLFVLVLVASAAKGVNNSGGNGLALSAVFGGLLVLAGACCVSSVVVASLAQLGRTVRGAARIAVRSVVRSRARSAAVVMALAAVNAGAVAMATAVDSHTHPTGQFVDFMPDNAVVVTTTVTHDNGTTFTPAALDASVASTLHHVLPNAQWAVRRIAAIPGQPLTGLPEGAGPDLKRGPGDAASAKANAEQVLQQPPLDLGVDAVTVADPAVIALTHLSHRDTESLKHAGALVLAHERNGRALTGTLNVQLDSRNRSVTMRASVAKDSSTGAGGVGFLLVTPAAARAHGLTIENAGEIVQNGKPFDSSQRASLQVLNQMLSSQTGVVSNATAMAWPGTGSNGISTQVFNDIVIAVTTLIALIVLAISLGLSSAETRDERDVLVSLGAKPSAMRSLAAWKAALLAAAGAIIAVPTGFVPIAVVYLAIVSPGEAVHLTFPWSTVLVLCIVAPLVAALVAYVGSGTAQKLRPTKMSTFATD
ncbi:MAG TPA: FtsX-like permease family protein [Acidimicrobiia bacterium]|jgi:putative ABC transport system permease protein